jgi:type IV pilus assembly protein PilA
LIDYLYVQAFDFFSNHFLKNIKLNTRNQKKDIMKKMQKGFTLIELMVVIVIIGILSALAIPKMFGVSAKAKAAEAPGVIANWETLQSAYAQETGSAGTFANIGFQDPTATSKFFAYTTTAPAATTTLTAQVTTMGGSGFGNCSEGDQFISMYVAATDVNAHSHAGSGTCYTYVPNGGF